MLKWRGREVKVAVKGSGTFTATGIAVTGKFELDIRHLGLQAPRFLMFKVADEVEVEVTLRATAK
jgi:hypothetical protein